MQVHLLILLNGIDAIAKQEKIIKKPLGLKPIKEQKSILDEFRQHLTPEDAEFIKQIDKQFKAHGDKLKIKIEKENATKVNNKNQKRTIDDSLGYEKFIFKSCKKFYLINFIARKFRINF